MADEATIKLEAKILPDAFKKTLTNLSFSVTPDSTEGWVIKVINVKVGDEVREGDLLVVQEAMKMEHTLLAQKNGMVIKTTLVGYFMMKLINYIIKFL